MQAIIEPSSSQKTEDYDPELSRSTPRKSLLSRMGLRIDDKVIYDAILGTSDGLTVPFALTAGLASVGTTKIVILGGLAELVAGAISMGLGGFIGAKSEVEAYRACLRKCDTLLEEPDAVANIIHDHFSQLGLSHEQRSKVVQQLSAAKAELVSFLMQHHFESEKPDTSRPYTSALVLGLSYFLSGFIALIPYFCVPHDQVYRALYVSIGVMAVVMLIFGYAKTCTVRGWKGPNNIKAGLKGALQMLLVGALAVGAAVGLVRAIEQSSYLSNVTY